MFWWSNLREITKWKKLRQSLQVIYKMYENIMSKNKTNGGQLNSLTKTAYDNAWIYHVFILYILKWSQQFSDRFACIRRKRKCLNRWMHIYLNSLIYSMQMILLYLSILNMQRAFTCFKHTAITANSISRPIKRTCVLCSEKIKVKHGHMTFILISFFLWKKKNVQPVLLYDNEVWGYENTEILSGYSSNFYLFEKSTPLYMVYEKAAINIIIVYEIDLYDKVLVSWKYFVDTQCNMIFFTT